MEIGAGQMRRDHVHAIRVPVTLDVQTVRMGAAAAVADPVGRGQILQREGVDAHASGRMYGNSSTSRIEAESVSSITRRSMPMPRPPVGGRPTSSARM
ncbi:hypothetical protein RLIN73S_01293 [Rhodanobacter lindaniclasticus]